jgi:hypothetical protein
VVLFDGVTALEAARIDAARGQAERARREYERFLRQFDMPATAVRHLAVDAKAELAHLQVPRDRR